jgi:heat shock protein HslJ
MKILFALLIIYACALNACKTTSQANAKRSAQIQRSITPADSLIQKQNTGVDFLAEGNKPASWTLEMDFDKTFDFRSSDGTILNLPAVKAQRLPDMAAESYFINIQAGQMKVILYDKTCSREQDIVNPSKIVEVTISNKRYTGCGKYLYDHRISNKWVLEYINNVKLTTTDYPAGLPRVELDLSKNKMYGYDGCNNISSMIEVQGSRLRFSPFVATKIACENNKVEKIFSEMLSDHLVDYYIKDGKLILYLIDDSKLIFIKKQ